MTDDGGSGPDASAEPGGGPLPEGLPTPDLGADQSSASVARRETPGPSRLLEPGGDKEVGAGLGVEEALRLLARAWPQPPRGENASTAPSTLGDRIGRFTIDSLLGHGGFGIVYLAHDDQLRRWVALKIPRPHVLADPRMAARLRREAQAAAGLDHPHIVPVLETGLSGPLWYLAMQYCDGPTLAEWLHGQKQPVPARLAARLVAGLAGALDYSHGKGVIHGDVKPANVLLFPPTDVDRARGLPWTPRLTDFGLARIETGEGNTGARGTRTGSLTMGTPEYMSPEQIQGTPGGEGGAGDIYALGIVLYELLIGRPPFQGTSFVDVADQARFVDPAPPRQLRRDVPLDLQSICLKCLEKEPEGRYHTAGELQADLESFLANRPTRARPPSAWGRVARWMRRNPERFALGAVATCAVLFGLGWLVTDSRLAVLNERAERERQTAKLERDMRRLGDIRQRRESREVGWQQRNFQDLIASGAATTDPEIRRQLRSEGVAVLSSVELRQQAIIRERFDGYGVAYSPDGRWLAVGHNTLVEGAGLALLFDAQTLELRRELRFPRSEHPGRIPGRRNAEDGVRSLLFSPSGDQLWLGTRGGWIHTWNLTDPNDPGRGWAAHETGVLALARLKRHDCLVSLSNRPVSVVRVWDPQSGEQRCEFPLREAGNELGVIDSDLLLEAEGRLERWQLDPATGERRVVWSQTESSRLVALHSDGQTVLGEQDQHLLAIDVETGRLRRRWTDQRTGRIQTGEFHELLVSADGHWLLTSSNEGLRLWDLLSWKMVGYINNPANCRVSAAFHPSRSELVLTRDGRVEVWQLVPSAISSVADIQSTAVVDFGLSADGSLLAQLLGDSGGEMAMVIGSLKTPELPPSRLALEWHTVPLVVVDATGRRVLSSLGGGEPSVGLIATGTGEPPQRLVSNAMLARFDPDGRRLWYCGSKKSDRQKPPSASADDVGFLAAYDLETGRETFRWLNETSQQRDSVSGLLALAVGRRVVAVSSVDQRMRLFDSATGELRWESPILGGLGDCVALDEEQGLVYCGTRHGELQGLDLATGDTRWRVPGHIEGVMSLDVAAGLVVSGGRSGQVVAWDLRGEVPVPLWTLGPFDGSVIRCQLTNDASRLAVLIEREHGVRIYDLEHLRLQFGHLRLDP